MSTFHLPDLGEGLSEAEIRQWHVAEGDNVEVDDPLVSVETAKAIVEVPSPWPGQIDKRHAQEGQAIATGAALVDILTEQDKQNKTTQTDKANDTSSTTSKADSGTVVGRMHTQQTLIAAETAYRSTADNAANRQSIRTTPAIRFLAQQHQISLASIQGTGPAGTITRADIEAAVAKQPIGKPSSADPHAHPQKLSNVDRHMAQLMQQSHREVVPVTVIDDADISNWPEHEDVTVRVIQAIVVACRAEPNLNAHFDSEQLTRTLFDCVHLGLALDTEHGLFVPVMRLADQLSAVQCREKINDFKARAVSRELSPEEMQGATIVLSNFGVIGGKYANPIVIPPSVAIIGIGHRFERRTQKQDSVIQQPTLPISLTFDHRAVTGGQASRFIAAMIDELQQTSHSTSN